MRIALSSLVAIALHAAGLAGVVQADLATQLPEFGHHRVIICILLAERASLHAGEYLLGSSEREVRAFFGEFRYVPHKDGGSSRKCLRYRFPNSRTLTFLLEGGVVTRTWLSFQSTAPEPCVGVVEPMMEVRGKSAWVWS